MQESSCHFMLSLIDDIMDLTRLEINKFKLTEESFDIRQVIHEVRDMIIMLIERKNLKFIIDVQELVPIFIKSDKKRLKQIIVNLLSNAVKFTFEGSIELRVRVEKRIVLNEGQLQ